MPMLDVFSQDAFNVVSLTTSINKMPYQPSRLGKMNLFAAKGITTPTAVIEEKYGKLSLLPTSARGTMPTVGSGPKRKVRSFSVPHIPYNMAVMADDVSGVRAFGSETELETVSQLVNDKLEQMRQDFEVTHEWHRIGAVRGEVLDADGTSVIYNFFDEFGITEEVVNFSFDADEEIKELALTVIRHIEEVLGMSTYRNIHALCGNDFFDALVKHASVKAAFDRWQDGQFLREQQNGEGGFEFAGITWENYRGKIGAVDFIPADEARFFPVGVPDLFTVTYAPANFIETVNTVGKAVYAKQERMKFDTGIELHSQSNPLFMCTRPSALVKGVIYSGSSSSSSGS